MALNGLFCADVPLRNYSLTKPSASPNPDATSADLHFTGAHAMHSTSA